MYLKSIEVQGFKSFANKMVLQFHDGITGIVGPNGSGKSNVADAVRWVLGEQRIKQLRGASMQDVIFAGTEMRKPLGYAYVAITLDNSDHQLSSSYDEVTVARKIYRSGESEYLINGVPCRLRDVNELFYDTGIGKEGYSIIGQGQIDRILSGKPEERRELFDEAAGIVKFKKRKDAALKKLESEKTNLIRVNDILSELEKQVGPLERQSEKAKVYLKKKEELKTVDVNMFLLENERLSSQLEQTTTNLKIASDDLEQTTAKLDQTKLEYERVQSAIETLDELIEAGRKNLADADLTRGKLEAQIQVLQEKINSTKNNTLHFVSRKDSIQKNMNLKNLDREKIIQDKSVIDEQAKKIEESRAEAVEKLLAVQKNIESLNAQIEKGKNSIIDALNARATIKSKLARLDSTTEQVNLRKAELTGKILRIKSDEAQHNTAIKESEVVFEKITKEIQELRDRQEEKEEKLALMREELANKDQKLRDTQQLYHKEKSTLEALVNLTERYEGYGGSVKKVMEYKEREKGIIGVVADIIQVDSKYETAIETALGGNIQNVVTENEQIAKKMIQVLKESRAGRATFLPLTSITNPQEFKTPEVLSEKGIIGMADELVKIDSKYRNVAKAMLGRIVVVDHVDNALKIAKKFDYGVRMVTLEGELLVPGGAISGGAFKNNSNLLGRRREIEELEQKIKDLFEQINSINEEIEHHKDERNKLRVSLEEIRVLVQRKLIEQNTARLNVEAAKERKEEAAKGSVELKNDEQDIENQIREIEFNRKEAQLELEASEKLEKDMEAQIQEWTMILEKARLEETSESALVSEWDVEVEKMLQQQGFHQQNIDRINLELSELNAEMNEVLESIEDSNNEIKQSEKNILEIEKTIAASHTTQSDNEKRLNEDIRRKEELSEKQKNFFSDRESLSDKMNGLDKEVYKLNDQKERIEEKLASQVRYMWEEYSIALSDAASLRDEEMNDLPQLKRQCAELKDQIRKLGDVNVNAIEDYRNLMERYTLLKTQHDDITSAQKSLEDIIEELDGAMRKQFREKFGQISKEFDKVFKELFGGGTGTLELMEDEDILEAGIKVIAQPPGKKLQNMMQLSGGEKALTAIALLFAIQNLKPSPFCLLDEIEAALDESNVTRFAKYLHKLTKHTQFIVITHRRGTMEKTDRLYGITMQEKGVSALVSVNLIDKELDD